MLLLPREVQGETEVLIILGFTHPNNHPRSPCDFGKTDPTRLSVSSLLHLSHPYYQFLSPNFRPVCLQLWDITISIKFAIEAEFLLLSKADSYK